MAIDPKPEPTDVAQWSRPDGSASDHLISAMHVERAGGHERVRLWNRGGLAGELMVCAGDAERIADAFGLVRNTGR